MDRAFPAVMLFALCALLAAPGKLFSLSRYSITPAHIGLALCCSMLPLAFFSTKGYWSSPVTKGLWGLRALGVMLFLAASFRLSISWQDVLALGGTLGLTLFYEVGFVIARLGLLRRFLRYWLWIAAPLAAAVLIVLLPLILTHGNVGSLVLYTNDVRRVIPSWPLYFGMYMVVTFWVAMASLKKDWCRTCLVAIVLLTLLFTLARTAALGLAVSAVAALILFWRRHRSVLSLVFLCAVAGLISLLVFYIKPSTGGGTGLEYTLVVRQARWQAGLEDWGEAPLVGIGLRSFTGAIESVEVRPGISIPTGSSHSDFVDLLVRGGLIWSAAFWLFVVVVVGMGFKRNRGQPMLGFLACGSLSLLIGSAFLNPLKDVTLAAFFWIAVAAIGAGSTTG